MNLLEYRVRLFARARDLVGSDMVTVRLAPGTTVADLRHRLALDYPVLAPLLARAALAVDEEFADDSLILSSHAELALLPPVSGGSSNTSALTLPSPPGRGLGEGRPRARTGWSAPPRRRARRHDPHSCP